MRFALLFVLCAAALGGEDPYLAYVRDAPEFKPVRSIATRTDDWLYMPWRHKWSIGTGDEGGRFCKEYGIRGGFLDHGRGPIDWLEKWKLRFYNDHTAGKGILYLRGANQYGKWKEVQRDPRGVRPVPLNAETIEKARDLVRRNLREVRRSPLRWAYSLDDEISWGVFVRPMAWRVHDHDEEYASWLKRYHGRVVEPRWVGPDHCRAQLDSPLRDLDFSPLLDRLSYQDSVLANVVGALVEEANRIDPETPCGFVGAQAPNAWGGYDYAKLMRKVQFLEPYDSGSAPEVARSIGRRRRVTLVSTHFHKDEPGLDSWKAWSRFAHGQRGMIGWVSGWFDGKTPRPWLKEFANVLREITRQGPKLARARFVHDGVAIYYSHPSVQVSWILDSEAHGKTWTNRNGDERLGTSHLVRKAWENMLNDAGLQYDFLAYDEMVRTGVPEEYEALILPACFALSDIEARRIREFAARGGRVVADFMCGLFDQHGRGRRKGALDDLFGVKHRGTETRADFFDNRLWVEADQDRGYRSKRWSDLLGSSEPRPPETRLGRPVRRGAATYLNLSPLAYLRLREEGRASAEHREPFLHGLDLQPDVRVEGDRNLETLRWTRGGRTLLLVVQNPPLRADGSHQLARGSRDLELHFSVEVHDVKDERTGERLGSGKRFRVSFNRAEAIFFSHRS